VATYRATPAGHSPIILFTAASQPELLAVQLATDGLLAKPFDLDDLLAIGRRSLTPSKAR
jgi:CheY-like chemotaxis protein